MQTDYQLLSRLGQGTFGVVLKARDRESRTIVALKQIQLRSELKSQLETYREIACLQNCDHENIVRLREVRFTSHTATLVLDFVESNLKLIIADVRRPQNIQLPKYYFVQLLYGLAYLHHLGIMHRDIKPENLLVTAKNKLRIADFGLACLYFANEPKRHYEHQVATRHYRAPELLFGATQYDPKVDIWAVGCILAEFLNGVTLFMGSNDVEQIVKVFHVLGTPTDTNWPGWERLPDSQKVVFEPIEPMNNWQTVVPTASAEFLRLLTRILRLNPRERPSAVECLRMEFFTRGVPTIVADYTPPSAEQVKDEARLRRKTAERAGRKSRRGVGAAQPGTDWEIIFDDTMDVEPYL